MSEKFTLWEKIKNGLRKIGDFFTGLSNIASYGAETTAVNKTLELFSHQMKEIDKSIKENATATSALTSQITTLNGEIAKIKDGLQIELFGSLQALHMRLKEQHYATLD